MAFPLRIGLAALCLLPAAVQAAVVIEHDEVGCVAAGKFPRFAARFDPADAVARARLHFRPEGWPHWYSVPMKKEGAKNRSGQPLSPQPRFSWSSSCACVRIDQSGLATYSSSFGPGTCASIEADDGQGNRGLSAMALQGSTAQYPCPPSR